MPFFLLSMHTAHNAFTMYKYMAIWLSYMAVHMYIYNLLFIIRYYNICISMQWMTYLDLLQIVYAMTFHVRHSFVFCIFWLFYYCQPKWATFRHPSPLQIANDGCCAIMHKFAETQNCSRIPIRFAEQQIVGDDNE